MRFRGRKTRKGDPNFGTVTAITFDEKGQRVAFGTDDGSLWQWEPTKLDKPDQDGRTANAPQRVGQFAPLVDSDGNEEFNLPRLVYFRDNTTLVGIAAKRRSSCL